MAKTTLLTISPEQCRGDDQPIVGGDVAATLKYLAGCWTWAFDDTNEEAIFTPRFIMPSAYTGSGTLKLDLHCHFASATSGNANFDARVEAVTAADALNLNTTRSFDAANEANVAADGGGAGRAAKCTISLTNKDSVVAGDLCVILIRRDAADGTNDTATGDVYLAGIELYEE